MKPLPFLAVLGLALLALGSMAGLPGAPARAAVPRAPLLATGDWPMYGHDPSHTSYNPAETLISSGNLGQLVSRWQANVGTNGVPAAGAPSVANGRVYVGSSIASGPNFFAFNAVTGAPAWSANLGYSNPAPSCPDFNVGIGATSAVAGNVIVAGGGDAAYYGLDASTGTQLWRHALNAGPSGFAWASPLISGNRAFIGVASRCDNPSVQGAIRALDLTTGVPQATVTLVPDGQAGAGIWNSPALSPDGGTLVAATGEDYNGYNGAYTRAMISLDPASLSIVQHHQQGPPNQDADYGTSPIVFHDSQNRVLVGATHKDGNFYAYVLNNISAGPVWSANIGVTIGLLPAYDPTFGAGGTLFIAGGGAQLYAVDPANGSQRWSATIGGYDNIAVANRLVFVNAGTGGLQIFDETTGTLLQTLQPAHAGDAYSGVAVANGFVYWLSGAYLNAWSLPAGAPTPTPYGPTPTPLATTPTPPGPTPTAAAPTPTPGGPTPTPGGPTPTGVPCTISFSDVQPTDYFYDPVLYLACHGVISGYADGTFRPYAVSTRAQIVKIVVLGFQTPITTPAAGSYTFADVPPGNPFWGVVETAAAGGIVSGYTCGGPGEPCDGQNRPYFRPYTAVTRGQLAKIDAIAAGWTLLSPAGGTFADVAPGTPFYSFVETAFARGVLSGYTCGGAGEPCDGANRPYFRPYNLTTRGQIAKIVYLSLSTTSTP